MRRLRRWYLLVCALLLVACTSPQPLTNNEPQLPTAPVVTATEPTPESAPATQPGPSPETSTERLLAEADTDGDGHPEKIFVNREGILRITRSNADPDLFAYQLPSGIANAVKAEVHVIPNSPPLVRVYWPWCPYGHPANLFIWTDRQSGKLTTDRAPDETMGICGTYRHLGDGRFEAVYRHNEFYYSRLEIWLGDHFPQENSKVDLIRIELDRLPDVLRMLSGTDISNPEVLFSSVDVYAQFKAKSEMGWEFHDPNTPAPETILLRVRAAGKEIGTLLIRYKVEAKFKNNILITGLEWQLL